MNTVRLYIVTLTSNIIYNVIYKGNSEGSKCYNYELCARVVLEVDNNNWPRLMERAIKYYV